MMIKKYELKHKKQSAILGILTILGILAFIFLLSFMMYLIQEATGFKYMFYIEFLLLIVCAVYIARKKLIEFTYYLEKRKIRIDRIYSARPKLDLLIEFKDVVFIGKYKELPDKYKSYKKQMETFKSVNGDSLCIVYFCVKKYFNAILSPSTEFEQKIMDNWKDYINSRKGNLNE